MSLFTVRLRMAMNRKLCLTVFLLSVLVLCAGLALAEKDPELQQCRHQCKVQRQFDGEQKERCLRKCEDYYKEKRQREQEREGERTEEEWGGGSREEQNTDEPEKHMRQCQKQCDRQEGAQQRMLCRLRCQEKYRREKEGEREHNKHKKESREEEEQQQEEEENPYVFEQHHFISRVKSEHGQIVVLPKFTQRSKLLRGLENYRLGIIVANPQTFLTPSHLDADGVFFVSWGNLIFPPFFIVFK